MIITKGELIATFSGTFWTIADVFKYQLSQNKEETYIVEIAGHDSLEALSIFLQEKTKHSEHINIFLTVVITRTQYGVLDSDTSNLNFVNQKCIIYNVVCHETIFLAYLKLWNILKVLFSLVLYHKYNFYSPCIDCHMYMYLIRIPLYKKTLNSVRIITGEHISHVGKTRFIKCFVFWKCLKIYLMFIISNLSHRYCIYVDDFDILAFFLMMKPLKSSTEHTTDKGGGYV